MTSSIDVGAEAFLAALWSYFSSEPLYYELFIICGERRIAKFFEGLEAHRKAAKWVEKRSEQLSDCHVYFGVLPRFRKPEKGRGSAQDVDRGQWLWVDFDYKQYLDTLGKVPIPDHAKRVAEERGYWYEELEDHALRAVYREGSKWAYVERPPLKLFLERLKERLGVEPSIVVDSGNGYHLYFKLDYELGARQLSQLEGLLVEALEPLGADKNSKDLARVLRLPGTTNPRIHRLVRVILWEPNRAVDPEDLRQRLESLRHEKTEVQEPRAGTAGFKPLGDNELLRLKEILKEVWVEGQRQFLALFMSGWLAKARIHPVSAAKLFKLIAEERRDNELEERLSTIYYSYKKLYGTIPELEELDSLIEEWKAQGILRHNVSKAISKELEERVKGKTGVQEILEATLGEERALEAVREIEEILGTASPFRDTVYELLDYEKQLYAAANLRKMVLARVRRVEDKIVYKERVAPVAPTKVTVYVNPLGGIRKYEVVFEGRTLTRPLHVGPAPIEDIVARLKAEGLVYHSRLIGDVLNAVIQGFVRKGRAEIREEIEAPGFYWVDGRLVAVRWEPRSVTREELREALNLLNELAVEWFGHVVEKFAMVVKWGIIAPFIYAMKQKGRWVPWLYPYGASHTGKTTQGEIVLHIWGLGSQYKKTGANIDTVPRLGHVLSQGTFPVLVNEPGAAIVREDVIEAMKNAIESTIVRGRYVRGSYVEIPSLAPLIITSNKALPRDDALLRRFLVLPYTYGERIDPERAKEFEEKVRPRLKKLEALGHWTAKRILKDPWILDKEWLTLTEELLAQAYRAADLEPPIWIKARYENHDDIYEELRENIREFLIERVNNAYFKAVGKVVVESIDGSRYDYRDPVDTDFEERVRIVAEKRLIPWLFSKDDRVIITSGFARELEKIVGNLGGLKSIAELLGWEYKNVKVEGKVLKALETSLRDLIHFLR